MNRFLGAFLLAGAIGVAIGACDNSSAGDYDNAGGGSGVDCSPYSSCDTCTPVAGCGWCFNASGGACAPDPDSCSAASGEFTWTWNQSGCPGVDASVEPLDAGTTTPEASAASDVGTTPAADTGTAVSEAAASGD
jgi:hypothetical protein